MSLLCGSCGVVCFRRLLLFAVNCVCCCRCGQLLFIAVLDWCLLRVVYLLVLFVASCLLLVVCCVIQRSVLFDDDGVAVVYRVLLLLLLLYDFLLVLLFVVCRCALLVADNGVAVCRLCLSLLSIVVC